MQFAWDPDHAVFTLKPQGDFSVLPRKRHYVVHFRGFGDLANNQITTSEECIKRYDEKTRTLTLVFTGTDVKRAVSAELEGNLLAEDKNLPERVFEFLDRVQGSTVLKNDVLKCFRQASDKAEIASGLMGLELPESWRAVLMEMAVR